MLEKLFYFQSGTLGISAYFLSTQHKGIAAVQRVAEILYALIIVYNIWLRILNVDQHMKSSPLMLYVYYNKKVI